MKAGCEFCRVRVVPFHGECTRLFHLCFVLRARLPGRKKLCTLAERLLGLTMSSHAAKRSAWNDSLYLTEVIVFAGYQLEFEPALLVV
jgi:hypothetical protein